MNTITNFETRLNEIEKGLRKLTNEAKKKSKLPKLILTSALVIEKLWRLIKNYWLE